MPTESIIRTSDNVSLSPVIGQLERLPKWLNLVPMIMQWLWLSIRYESVSLPSAANPAITSGGMVGEGKLEYFNIMGPKARAATADFTFVKESGKDTFPKALAAMTAAKLAFPVIAKPDIGWCGFGVRRLNDAMELEDYLKAFPIGEVVILQHFVPYEGEAGIFYARHPHDDTGQIIGIVLRSFPKVIGDGKHNVDELMSKNPRLKRLGRDGLHQGTYDPSYIPAQGETVRLATIGSTRVGGLYQDGSHTITPGLTAAMEAIARDMPGFHMGRFDVRYENLDALQKGRFRIIEVNGSGADAVHAWDPKFSIRQSYGIIFAKQRLLFRIAAEMRRHGHKPVGLYRLARLYFRQQKLISRYPPSN